MRVFAYMLHKGSQLTDQDKQEEVHVSEYFLKKLANDAVYLKKVISFDECHSSLSGGGKKQSCQIRETEHAQEVYQVPQSGSLIMAWCGISETDVIGPYRLDNESVVGESYKRMLQTFFFSRLREYLEGVAFQQHDVPPHFALPVRQYLEQKLEIHCIDRDGPVAWSPCSEPKSLWLLFLGMYQGLCILQRCNYYSGTEHKDSGLHHFYFRRYYSKVMNNTEFRFCLILRQNGAHFKNLSNWAKLVPFLLQTRYESLEYIDSYKT